MRAPAIAGHRIAAKHGLSEGTVPFERHFLSVANGLQFIPNLIFLRVTHILSSYSVLPAISLDGILHVNIVEGSFTTETFAEFIEGLLDKMNPFPGPNSVIVMDNCRIHKAEIIREMIENRYDFISILLSFLDTIISVECAASTYHPTHQTTIRWNPGFPR
jgi:hypothetical protein